MTGPTREEVEEWARESDPSYPVLGILHTPEDLQRFAAIAIRSREMELYKVYKAAVAVTAAMNDPSLDIPIATAVKIGPLLVALERAALAFAAGARSGEDARDAARYRWLRTKANTWQVRYFNKPNSTWYYPMTDRLDAAIDAAMGGADA